MKPPFSLSPDERRRLLERTQRDPEWFARNVLGVEPYDKQVQILESVRDHPQTSVVGANGVGKDWTIGQIVIPWWMASHADSKLCKVIVTGPTFRQVSDIVWRETRAAYNNARFPLGGRMLPSEAKWDCGDQYFALGFSTDKAFNITGFHSQHLLVIVTEAHNVAEDTFVMLKRLQPERLLLSFNAFSQSGEAFESQHGKRHLYNPIVITAYDSPNVRNGNDLVPGVVTQSDIDGYAEDWGIDSPYFKSTVLAEFGETEDGLLPLEWLMRAQDREAIDKGGDLQAGIDVAGPGEDETVGTLRQGANILDQRSWRIPDPRGEVLAWLSPYRGRLSTVNIDSAGIGYYFAQHIQDQGLPVRFVNVGESARDSEHYANLKAEHYWGLRMRLRDGGINGLPPEAVGQLSSIRYGHNARGQVQIEKKEDAKKRGVKSPDKAESVMLAFAYGDEIGSTADLISSMESRTLAPALVADISQRDAVEDERSEEDTWVGRVF